VEHDRPTGSLGPDRITKDGLPVGVQIVGRMGGEADILRAGARDRTAAPAASAAPADVPMMSRDNRYGDSAADDMRRWSICGSGSFP